MTRCGTRLKLVRTMCSILALLDLKATADSLRTRALQLSKLQRHRGPDWSGVYQADNAILVHERLAIVGVDSGSQPLLTPSGELALAVNGEIYNHVELEQGLEAPFEFQTKSDCEVILALYEAHGTAFLDQLRGMFAFVLYDDVQDRYVIARDHMGIIPLYTGHDADGTFYVASEMKALVPHCDSITEFPPGHFLDSKTGELERFWSRDWFEFDAVAENDATPEMVADALTESVHSHLMCDVPYGVLLSGGLDSSLIAALAAKMAATRVEENDESPAWWPRLHSFSIGLEGSPDLAAAQEVADHIGTVHHGLTFTVQDGIDALSDVIHHVETYDVTSIRASTPMYLLARMIKAMGIKMVLSGEGADEIFGGYLYFHKAPDAEEFHKETVRKLQSLHLFDCLRANKSMAAWGVEARVPFLDKRFMDVAMRLKPDAKMCGGGKAEKQILRDALGHMLPERIAKRQKEQFSDGVGYSWIDSLKEHAETAVSDQQLANAAARFPINPPATKEGYYYRTIFAEHFPAASSAACVPGGKSVACSTETALEWDAAFKEMADPSGRAVRSVHNDAY